MARKLITGIVAAGTGILLFSCGAVVGSAGDDTTPTTETVTVAGPTPAAVTVTEPAPEGEPATETITETQTATETETATVTETVEAAAPEGDGDIGLSDSEIGSMALEVTWGNMSTSQQGDICLGWGLDQDAMLDAFLQGSDDMVTRSEAEAFFDGKCN
jgi:hypothetical protein